MVASSTSSSASTPSTKTTSTPIAYSVNCVLDQQVLNADTFPQMTQLGLSVFAPLCGRNRGVFVTNPGDGETYGCANLPPNVAHRAAVMGAAAAAAAKDTESDHDNSTLYPIVDVNAIDGGYQNGNLTSGEVVNVLDWLIQSIYNSSGTGVSGDVHACDVSGLTRLDCPTVPTRSHPKLRAANLAGVLSPSTPWLTGGKPLTVKEAKNYYTSSDFDDMYDLGLNAVQIPVASEIFIVKNETTASQLDVLSGLVEMADNRGMHVIVLMDEASSDSTKNDSAQSNEEATRAAATFLADVIKNSQDIFVGLILPDPSLIAAARQVSLDLNVFVRAGEGSLADLHLPADPHLFIALDRTHTASAADVASSTALDDRLKLYYHENLACQGRAPIEFGFCYRQTPVYVFKGFNVAIDDCVLQHQPGSSFNDYGQCDRLDDRTHSPWWKAHLASFASRQLAGYEAGMGWAFDAWKIYDEDPQTVDLLDDPAKMYALKNVAKGGLFPSLRHTGASHYKLACLNNPEADFVLGDDTLAPTPGPPPDCGNGWWNYETLQCDYWIPPTPCPTVQPIPTCDNGGFWSADLGTCDYCPEPLTRTALVHSGLVGGAVGLVLGAVIAALWSRRCHRDGYSEVPTATINV